MTYRIQESVFDKFFKNRESLIIQFKNGDITKKEFIEEHYAFIQRLNLKPFKYRIDSFEKGIYNYQYYNMLAKYSYMKSKDEKLQRKHPMLAKRFAEDADYYYNQKDKSTMKLLEFLDFQNVEAYFVKVKSPLLKDKLFEIVLMDYENVIFHSKSTWLLERLREENVFIEGKKRSLIDTYINTKY
ncbi:MAG: DUF6648 family protein [Bacillota bacterium]